MARLIDADEIGGLFYKKVDSGTNLLDAFDDALKEAQTIDAVNVVRCKYCTFLDTEGCPMNGIAWDVQLNDFCSYGERTEVIQNE